MSFSSAFSPPFFSAPPTTSFWAGGPVFFVLIPDFRGRSFLLLNNPNWTPPPQKQNACVADRLFFPFPLIGESALPNYLSPISSKSPLLVLPLSPRKVLKVTRNLTFCALISYHLPVLFNLPFSDQQWFRGTLPSCERPLSSFAKVRSCLVLALFQVAST